MPLDKQKALQELGIPETLYNELVGDFIKQAHDTLEKLDELKKTDNFEEIAKTAHFIKGSAGNLRIEAMYVLAKDIEFAAKQKKESSLIQESIEKLKVSLEELKRDVS